MGHKKYNGLELDERSGACLVAHGFSRDTKTPRTTARYATVPTLSLSGNIILTCRVWLTTVNAHFLQEAFPLLDPDATCRRRGTPLLTFPHAISGGWPTR